MMHYKYMQQFRVQVEAVKTLTFTCILVHVVTDATEKLTNDMTCVFSQMTPEINTENK